MSEKHVGHILGQQDSSEVFGSSDRWIQSEGVMIS